MSGSAKLLEEIKTKSKWEEIHFEKIDTVAEKVRMNAKSKKKMTAKAFVRKGNFKLKTINNAEVEQPFRREANNLYKEEGKVKTEMAILEELIEEKEKRTEVLEVVKEVEEMEVEDVESIVDEILIEDSVEMKQEVEEKKVLKRFNKREELVEFPEPSPENRIKFLKLALSEDYFINLLSKYIKFRELLNLPTYKSTVSDSKKTKIIEFFDTVKDLLINSDLLPFNNYLDCSEDILQSFKFIRCPLSDGDSFYRCLFIFIIDHSFATQSCTLLFHVTELLKSLSSIEENEQVHFAIWFFETLCQIVTKNFEYNNFYKKLKEERESIDNVVK